jgi:ribosomal protein L33
MQNNGGRSALYASNHNGHTETAKLLLDHGANVNMQSNKGCSALYVSSRNGHTETAKLLLDHGACVNEGRSALYASSRNGHTETAKLLLDCGANVNMQNNKGLSALYVSSRNGHTETAKLLLDCGATVNMQNNEGRSALYASSRNGHTETAKLLLDRGANVKMQVIELQSEERKRIVASQESKPPAAQASTVQKMIRFAGETLQPPSPYYAPTPGPSSVDSGYASWGTGPSPAPSWMSAPSPGSALSPAPSLGVLSPAGSEFGLPLSPAQPSPLLPKSPYPAKYAAFKQMSSSVSTAQPTGDQDITGMLHTPLQYFHYPAHARGLE